MRLGGSMAYLISLVIAGWTVEELHAFSFPATRTAKSTPLATKTPISSSSSSALFVTIGLGPGEEATAPVDEYADLVPGVDYEVPDHEAYRTSRRSKLDEECDTWFTTLLESSEESKPFLKSIGDQVLEKLMTPVELKNEVRDCASSLFSHTSFWCLTQNALVDTCFRFAFPLMILTLLHSSIRNCPGLLSSQPTDVSNMAFLFPVTMPKPGANSMSWGWFEPTIPPTQSV